MQRIQLIEKMFKGAVSLETTEHDVKPWRVPFDQADLFVPGYINGKAEVPAGVRIALLSTTRSIQINVVPVEDDMEMDCVIDGSLERKGIIHGGEATFMFDSLPEREKRIEIYLSQKIPVQLTGLWIDDNAKYSTVPNSRPHWIAYGSSITQCSQAESPSQTWPALAAEQLNLDLTCLGFGGNCHLEPMVARMIRDMPTDMISICAGINIMGSSSLSERTFASALIGFVQIIREKHPTTPIILMSPIFSRERETTENLVGLTLEKMREEIVQVQGILERNGDRNLYGINGLDLFGEEYEEYLPDGLHPDAEGYKVMAQHFQELIDPSIFPSDRE